MWEARSSAEPDTAGRGGPLGANLGALPPRCPQTGPLFRVTRIEVVRDRL